MVDLARSLADDDSAANEQRGTFGMSVGPGEPIDIDFDVAELPNNAAALASFEILLAKTDAPGTIAVMGGLVAWCWRDSTGVLQLDPTARLSVGLMAISTLPDLVFIGVTAIGAATLRFGMASGPYSLRVDGSYAVRFVQAAAPVPPP